MIRLMLKTDDKIVTMLKQGTANRTFTGANAAWCGPDGDIVSWSAGTTASDGLAVTSGTLFDIASITKMFVAAAILRLADRAVLNLNREMAYYVQAWPKDNSWQKITVAHLLAHESGLMAWAPLFDTVPLNRRGDSKFNEEMVNAIFKLPLMAEPGTVICYSDLGYILLGHMLCEVTGCSLETVIKKEVTEPLGLDSVTFLPLKADRAVQKSAIASTRYCSWRKKRLTGEVDDDNSWTMGGVAGHAGLFATGSDLCKFGYSWLISGRDGSWIKSETIKQAIKRRPLGRGLGVDLKSGEKSTAGLHAGAGTFGHLGFTGCSLWIDPDSKTVVALLTNRVYFSIDNDKIKSFRPAFNDLLFKEGRSDF
jgi:CubicO group peptidase (beta-lactamase class C family)